LLMAANRSKHKSVALTNQKPTLSPTPPAGKPKNRWLGPAGARQQFFQGAPLPHKCGSGEFCRAPAGAALLSLSSPVNPGQCQLW